MVITCRISLHTVWHGVKRRLRGDAPGEGGWGKDPGAQDAESNSPRTTTAKGKEEEPILRFLWKGVNSISGLPPPPPTFRYFPPEGFFLRSSFVFEWERSTKENSRLRKKRKGEKTKIHLPSPSPWAWKGFSRQKWEAESSTVHTHPNKNLPGNFSDRNSRRNLASTYEGFARHTKFLLCCF